MATRPAWTIRNNRVVSGYFDFEWFPGFSVSQKQRSISSLHKEIIAQTKGVPLEVSTKSIYQLGYDLSAFSLKLEGKTLENIYQSSKVYENGGPYLDLLKVDPGKAKRDPRHKSSGVFKGYQYKDLFWEAEPKTAFYDYIYVQAVIEKFGTDLNFGQFNWFTDIEFNPKKSINCQARAITLYKLLQGIGLIKVCSDPTIWIKLHKTFVCD
jgi:hypothetical protein